MKYIFGRIKDKLRRQFYHFISSRYGYGNRVCKTTWNFQFKAGLWDYLYSEQEATHYQQIAWFKNQYKPDGRILDVGCGQGVLYPYLKKDTETLSYYGIDISDQAIRMAKENFPLAEFKSLDYERQKLEVKFDVIIFNETLYYFKNPLKQLKIAIHRNLYEDGILIISMCAYHGHDKIWEKLEKNYSLLVVKEIANERGQKWKVAVIKL